MNNVLAANLVLNMQSRPHSENYISGPARLVEYAQWCLDDLIGFTLRGVPRNVRETDDRVLCWNLRFSLRACFLNYGWPGLKVSHCDPT